MVRKIIFNLIDHKNIYMKKILIALIVLLLACFIGYKYVYQSHRDIQSEDAAFTMEAKVFASEFSQNQEEASKKYLNQTVVVTGQITEVEDEGITVSEAIYAALNATNSNSLKTGDQIKLKGRCIGYDELLEVVRLDQCAIIE